jgi:hypothetical protein
MEEKFNANSLPMISSDHSSLLKQRHSCLDELAKVNQPHYHRSFQES